MSLLTDKKIASETALSLSDAARHRERFLMIWGALLALVTAGTYVATKGDIVVPFALLILGALFTFSWLNPETLMLFSLGSCCIFDVNILGYSWPRIDQIPLFWDTNTVFQRYAHLSDFHALPFSIFELMLIFGVLSSAVRSVVDHRFSIRIGFLGLIFLFFTLSVGLSIMTGILTGGLYNIALIEARAPIYMGIAYILAVNSKHDFETIFSRAMWVCAICISIKALHAVIRYLGELHGTTIAEVGIGAHEESFFFDAFIFLFLILNISQKEPKLRNFMAYMLPFVIWMDLANQRRAATAAFIIVLPVILAYSVIAFKKRRAAIFVGTAIVAVLGCLYLAVFWNHAGAIGQPARAIKSEFTPDPRDLSSNNYRVAEASNLVKTMKSSPLIGYGFGKPFFVIDPMVDLTSIDPLIHYIPHNSLLWVWMRLGSFGFILFWLIVSRSLIEVGLLCRDPELNEKYKLVAIFSGVGVAMLLVFGLYDMQIACIRDTLFVGIWLGLLAKLSMERERGYS